MKLSCTSSCATLLESYRFRDVWFFIFQFAPSDDIPGYAMSPLGPLVVVPWLAPVALMFGSDLSLTSKYRRSTRPIQLIHQQTHVRLKSRETEKSPDKVAEHC